MRNPLARAPGILLLLLVACPSGEDGGGAQAPGVLAKVGDAAVTSSDVAYKLAVESAYGNRGATETAALVALVNDALEREVGRLVGVTVSPEEISALNEHAERTTKAPEVLAGVKRAFGDDRAAYRRLYLAPRITNTKLRAWYSRNAEIHATERAVIEKAYHLARSGQAMEEAARDCGLEFSVIDLGEREGTLPAPLRKYFPPDGGSSKGGMRAIAATLDEGELYQNIVEDDHGYKVVKLARKNGSVYTAEVIRVDKRPFARWFLEQAAEIEVEILDAELRDGVTSEYPGVWWVKRP